MYRWWLASVFGLAIVVPVVVRAQASGEIVFSRHLIDDHSFNNASLHAFDLDGDGELEILGAAIADDMIVYWDRDGGDPDSWSKRVVDDLFFGAKSANAADLDGDGDLDVIGAAWDMGEVSWWRNDGGTPLVWSKHSLDVYDVYPHEVDAVDIDGDGDQDVLSASSGLNNITLWVNDGRPSPRWTKQVVGGAFREAKSVTGGDVDGDGRVDLVGAALAASSVIWWRNRGGQPIQWDRLVVDTSFGGAHRVQLVDLDEDGDLDIVGAGYDGVVAWWRNDGGSPVRWIKQVLVDGWNAACVAQAADLDGDGDLDIAATSQYAGEIVWWRNEGGRPISWSRQLVASIPGAWPLDIVDLDRDGDNDIVAAGWRHVEWYRNEGRMIRVRPSPAGRVRP